MGLIWFNARMKRALLVCGLAVLVLGCHDWKERTYSVSVKNNGPEPVTVWLTKDGEPYEQGWFSPEVLIRLSPKSPPKEISGVVIPAGKTADTGERKGRFAENTHAILRVYVGNQSINDLLAMHPGARRQDLVLEPGKNAFTVSTPGGALNVVPGN